MAKLTTSTKPTPANAIHRKWRLIDAKNRVLGRLATEAATFLTGKRKREYIDYFDTGDYVVIVNASKVKLTGKKREHKVYDRYSGYPGGLKKIKADSLLQKNPREVVERAISGMLPKNKLRKKRMRRVFVYRDEKHPHEDKVKT